MGKTNPGESMYIYVSVNSLIFIYATTRKYAKNYADRKLILCGIYYWKRNRRGSIPQMVFKKIKQ